MRISKVLRVLSGYEASQAEIAASHAFVRALQAQTPQATGAAAVSKEKELLKKAFLVLSGESASKAEIEAARTYQQKFRNNQLPDIPVLPALTRRMKKLFSCLTGEEASIVEIKAAEADSCKFQAKEQLASGQHVRPHPITSYRKYCHEVFVYA